LDLRNIKSTLGMDQLSCKTPAMVEKEIWIYLLAYNLIRLAMCQAALHAGCTPRDISFKHSLQLWLIWQPHTACELPDRRGIQRFLLMAQQRVGKRNGRVQPSALKRRATPYPPLTQARPVARGKIRIHGHPAKLK